MIIVEAVQQEIIKIKDTNKDFINEVIQAGGEGVQSCYQCGTCAGGCPTEYVMDYSPRKIMRMIQLGLKDKVLESTTIWLCASCNTCVTRCPRDVKIANVMAACKSLAIKEGYHAGMKEGPAFYNAMVDNMKSHGRLFEGEMMVKYFNRSGKGLKGLLEMAPLGYMMFKKGKIAIMPHNIKGLDQIKTIVANIEKMERGE